MFYSKTTNAFYDPAIHNDVPKDAVTIQQEDYQILLDGQSQGKLITSDSRGYPVLVDPPSPTPEIEQLMKNQVALDYLNSTDWYVVRFTETGVPIPPEITAAREEARKSIVVA